MLDISFEFDIGVVRDYKYEGGSMMLKVYGKKSCGTCKRAWSFLDKKKVPYENYDIVQNPPTRSVLEKVVSGKDVRSSLNQKCKTFKEKKLG